MSYSNPDDCLPRHLPPLQLLVHSKSRTSVNLDFYFDKAAIAAMGVPVAVMNACFLEESGGFLEIFNKLIEIIRGFVDLHHRSMLMHYFTNKKTSQPSPLALDNKLLANYPSSLTSPNTPSPFPSWTEIKAIAA